MSTEIATAYWQAQSQYPFGFTRKRRLHELNYLIPRLERAGGKRFLDLGCGDGSLLECLLRTTDYEEFYGCDVAADLLRDINPRVHTFVFDISRPVALPEVDAAVVAGVIQYVFDDHKVRDLFERIRAPIIWVRSTCTLLPQDEHVVRDGYASCYRTVAHTRELFSKNFEVSEGERVYPDELESAFGTKQYYFECQRRK